MAAITLGGTALPSLDVSLVDLKAMSISPILVIHGGAWAMPDDVVTDHERGIAAALRAGYAELGRGASSVDAVQAAVTIMEDDDTFDAGRGSFLTRDGRVQLDALLMDGENLRTGGVACVERIRNPIAAARLVLDYSPHVYFVATGAERFVRQHGMQLIDNTELIIPRERDRLIAFQKAELEGRADATFSGSSEFTSAPIVLKADTIVRHSITEAAPFLPGEDPTLESHDTVGAVAIDTHGNLAAATSTGGTLSKAPGRVGDSSLIGCGCYADNYSAAVSLTGWGEPIMKLVLGKWAVDRVAAGHTPQQSATDAIAYLHTRLGGHGGIILIGPDGQIGIAHNTPRMAWGFQDAAGPRIGITRNE